MIKPLNDLTQVQYREMEETKMNMEMDMDMDMDVEMHIDMDMVVEIGHMIMPPDFKYRKVYLAGKPRHPANDRFLIRHPHMPSSRWAKIFSPFDALKGFRDKIAESEMKS